MCQKGEQVWVGVWIYVGKRADRDRLFGDLQKQRPSQSKAHLEQYRDGTPCFPIAIRIASTASTRPSGP
jgi:hypothetical protein